MALNLDHALDPSGPRYLAIADTIQRGIILNELLPGDRLPTHREMATRLGVDVGTVTRAYAELKRRGLIAGEVGRGSFVLQQRPQAPETLGATAIAGMVDLSHNFPVSSPDNPRLAEMAQALRGPFDVAGLMTFQADVGLPSHRAMAAQWLARFGAEAQLDDVVLTAGAQHAVLMALQATTEPGDIVLTESHTYYGALSACALLGRTPHGVEMDAEGILPDALERACRDTGASVLYCMPTLHNPTTATMGAARREAVAAVCRRHNVAIIEDDVYGFLLSEPLPPLRALAPERTIYLTSLSKIVGPGLRLGFVAAARQWHARLAAALRSTTLMAPALIGELAARLIRDGAMDRMADARRAQVRERQDWAARLLGERHRSDRRAFHIWLATGPQWTCDTFAAAAREQGVGVAAGGLFAIDAARCDNAVRICVSAAGDQAALARALQTLNRLLDDGPLIGRAIV